MKKMSTGFKVTVVVLAVVAIVLLTSLAGGIYLLVIKSNSDQEALKKQVARLEKMAMEQRSGGSTGSGETTEQMAKDPYENWQKYENKTYKVSVRYPAGWTYEEGTGSLHVAFLGPETSGGVITHECAFRIFVEDALAGGSLNGYVEAAQEEPMGGGTVITEGPETINGNTAYKVIDTYMDVGHQWQRIRIWTMKNNQAYTFFYEASTNYSGNNYYTAHLAEAELWLASISLD